MKRNTSIPPIYKTRQGQRIQAALTVSFNSKRASAWRSAIPAPALDAISSSRDSTLDRITAGYPPGHDDVASRRSHRRKPCLFGSFGLEIGVLDDLEELVA